MAKILFDVQDLCLTHARVDRWLRLKIAKALESSDLTMMEWLLIMSVNDHNKTGLTITEVAEQLEVSLPQITALTQQLQKKDFIKQVVEREDRRSRRLLITSKGEAACSSAKRSVGTVLEAVSEAPQLKIYRRLLANLVERPAVAVE